MGKYDYIEENLKSLRKRIGNICRNTGRDPAEINLVAVSKTFPAEAIASALDYNQLDFGENRVQELMSKHNELADRIMNWHLVGHLQTNKVKYIVPFVYLVHSVDSFKLALKIQQEASGIDKTVRCLIQVNTSGEEQKSGCEPRHALKLVKEVSGLPNLKVQGLMTIGKFLNDNSSEAEKKTLRENFRQLRELYDEIGSVSDGGWEMRFLSMGMTLDLDIALEEGSNMLRVGTAIFGART